MAFDAIDINTALPVKVIGADATGVEQTPVSSTTQGDGNVADVIRQQALDIVLNLTTTPQLGKVGASNLANRKYIEMQALGNNVKWGYSSSCIFDLFKNQFFALPIGEDCDIYFKTSTGTTDLAFAEK